MKSRIIASMLVRRDDSYLFIRQNKVGGAYPGTLHIPGGGLEEDESPIDAAVREVREEVGIEVTAVEVADFDWDILPYKGEETMLIFLRFIGLWFAGEATPASDAKEVHWIHRDDLPSQNHNPPSLRLLKRLGLIK